MSVFVEVGVGMVAALLEDGVYLSVDATLRDALRWRCRRRRLRPTLDSLSLRTNSPLS